MRPLSQAALAQSSIPQNQSSSAGPNTQAPEALPQELEQRLSSAGFSEIKVVPSSFVVSAKDENGRPVLMRITPTSTTVLTEAPVGGASTTGAGGDNPSGSGQTR